jgi:hypothetical protein
MPPPVADRIVGKRALGSGFQYQLKWSGSEEMTWEAASRVKRELPALVEAFERQPQEEQQPANAADELLAMREQMAALMNTVHNQSQQLQQLRASPGHSPEQSPHRSPQLPSSTQSRFARKEPRAQDLREYDGAAGTKLDEWLQELSLATHLFQLNAVEASSFAVSRLRGAALQWWLSLDSVQSPLL